MASKRRLLGGDSAGEDVDTRPLGSGGGVRGSGICSTAPAPGLSGKAEDGQTCSSLGEGGWCRHGEGRALQAELEPVWQSCFFRSWCKAVHISLGCQTMARPQVSGPAPSDLSAPIQGPFGKTVPAGQCDVMVSASSLWHRGLHSHSRSPRST